MQVRLKTDCGVSWRIHLVLSDITDSVADVDDMGDGYPWMGDITDMGGRYW